MFNLFKKKEKLTNEFNQEIKGNSLTKDAFKRLKKIKWQLQDLLLLYYMP